MLILRFGLVMYGMPKRCLNPESDAALRETLLLARGVGTPHYMAPEIDRKSVV